jgi:hypothetical protein
MAAWLLLSYLASTPVSPGPTGGTRGMMEDAVRNIAGARVGEWVTYRYDGASPARRGFWRLAVVGEDTDVQGRAAYWVEMEVGSHVEMRSPLMQVRMLIARQPGARDAVTRLLVAMGYEKPREVAAATLAELTTHDVPVAQPSTLPVAGGRTRRGRPQRLATPAGVVTAYPLDVLYRSTVLKRLWMSEEIPFLGLAKVEVPLLEHVMEVSAFGRDAQPRMVLPADSLEKLELTDLESLGWLASAARVPGPGGGP